MSDEHRPDVDPRTGCCASCSFPLLRLGPADAWTERASAIEATARRLVEGLDAQDLPVERREALLLLRVALAK